MEFLVIHSKIDMVFVCLLAFSLFGFVGNVMLDYNWGTNPITNSFALIYSMTLRQLFPFPIGYYGAGAGIYLGLFLLSFLMLNRGTPLRRNLLETVRMASVVVILFELGLYYFVPYFMDVWVIAAFIGTPLQGFTNWDLLAFSIGTLGLTQSILLASRRRN